MKLISFNDFNNSFFNALVYYDNGVKGIILYSLLYDRIEIEYIIVHENYRKQGIGKDMMSLAISNLQEKGCKTYMIDWTGLMELYRKFNFEVWKSYCLLN